MSVHVGRSPDLNPLDFYEDTCVRSRNYHVTSVMTTNRKCCEFYLKLTELISEGLNLLN